MEKIIKIFYSDNDNNKPLYVKVINSVVVIIIFILVLSFSYIHTVTPNLSEGETVIQKLSENLYKIYDYRNSIIAGFILTIYISIAALFGSVLLGLLGALSQLSKIQIFHYIGKIYVEIIRGTPLLVQIIIMYYFIGMLFNLNNKFIAGVLILSIFEGAYISEIIRAGIESISKTQIETARSLSFTTNQTYLYIIFPQVMRRTLPPLAGQFVSLIKDSSLLSIIALSEFTLSVQNTTAINFNFTEGYIVLGIGYLTLTFFISLLSKYLEARFLYET